MLVKQTMAPWVLLSLKPSYRPSITSAGSNSCLHAVPVNAAYINLSNPIYSSTHYFKFLLFNMVSIGNISTHHISFSIIHFYLILYIIFNINIFIRICQQKKKADIKLKLNINIYAEYFLIGGVIIWKYIYLCKLRRILIN